MKVVNILFHIGILYFFYFIGVWIQQTLHLFIPGSIIGMLLLLLLFTTKVIKPKWIEQGTTLLLQHMPLLFLPVTIGILNFLDVFAGKGMLLIFVALISTWIVMISSGLTSQVVAVRKERKYE